MSVPVGSGVLARALGWTALLALSSFFVAQDPPTSARLGAGPETYTWVSAWPALSAEGLPGNTHGGVAFDRTGRVWINTDTAQALMVFEPDGTLVKSLGAELAGGLHGMIFAPRSAGQREEAPQAEAAEADEYLILAHTQRGVLGVELDGTLLWEIAAPAEAGVYSAEKPWAPTGVALGPNGHLYVADGYGQSVVLEFDAERRFVRTIGGPGTEPGRFRTPHGICIDRRGKEPLLLVADRENGRLQSFTLDGEHVAVLGAEHLRRPCSIAERDGHLVVADLAGRVTILGRENELLTHLGENPDPSLWAQNGVPREAWRVGAFLAPHCAAWNDEGDLYVVDWNRNGRVTKLAR